MISIVLTMFLNLTAPSFAFESCGKLVNGLMKIEPKENKASFKKFFFSEDEFCDNAMNETYANFDILFLDNNTKVVMQKSIFMNTFTVLEGSLSKKEMILGKTKLVEDPQFRTVKFQLPKNVVLPLTYKIISKSDKKVYGEGVVK